MTLWIMTIRVEIISNYFQAMKQSHTIELYYYSHSLFFSHLLAMANAFVLFDSFNFISIIEQYLYT